MNLKRALLVSLAGFVLAFGLSGCGFKLRGQAQLPFESAYVEGRSGAHNEGDRNELRPAQSASLTSALRQALKTQDKLAASAEGTPVRIILSGETLSKSILSLSGGGKVREYRLTYKVGLKVVDQGGNELISPSAILLTRDYSYSDTAILAKEAEEATLIRGMEQEALRQVLRRLSFVKR